MNEMVKSFNLMKSVVVPNEVEGGALWGLFNEWRGMKGVTWAH